MSVLSAALLPFIIFVIFWARLALNRKPNPPGPPGLPLLGNIRDNAGPYKQAIYKRLAETYGPLIYLRVLNERIFVLSTRELATELLDKRSAIYTDRQQQVMCGEMMSWNRGLALSRAGPRHRTYRRLVNQTLSATATKAHWATQVKAARTFLHSLHQECTSSSCRGDEFLAILRRTVGLNVVGIIFGADPASPESTEGLTLAEMENYIELADRAHALFAQALTPFTFFVDYLPFLRYVPAWLPSASFKRVANVARAELENLTYMPYKKTRDRIVNGQPQTSYLDTCFSNNPAPNQDEENNFAWTAMSAYTGGSDTTIAGVTTIFLASALHVDAQILAQQELDAVVGSKRFPTFSDRSKLPYVSAFVEECLRAAPVVPLGVAHSPIQDDFFKEYDIPKGSTVIANIWAILNDPMVYSSPFEFKPSRFLPKHGIPTHPDLQGQEEPSIGSIPFGYGRRICPGQHLADSGLWIFAATVLWAFNIRLRRDPGDPEVHWGLKQFTDGAIMSPRPFKVFLTPRFNHLEQLLTTELE